MGLQSKTETFHKVSTSPTPHHGQRDNLTACPPSHSALRVGAGGGVLDLLDEAGHVFEEEVVHILLVHVAELHHGLHGGGSHGGGVGLRALLDGRRGGGGPRSLLLVSPQPELSAHACQSIPWLFDKCN